MAFNRLTKKTVFLSCPRDMFAAGRIAREIVEESNKFLPLEIVGKYFFGLRSGRCLVNARDLARTNFPHFGSALWIDHLLSRRATATVIPDPEDLQAPDWLSEGVAIGDDLFVPLTGTTFEAFRSHFWSR